MDFRDNMSQVSDTTCGSPFGVRSPMLFQSLKKLCGEVGLPEKVKDAGKDNTYSPTIPKVSFTGSKKFEHGKQGEISRKRKLMESDDDCSNSLSCKSVSILHPKRENKKTEGNAEENALPCTAELFNNSIPSYDDAHAQSEVMKSKEGFNKEVTSNSLYSVQHDVSADSEETQLNDSLYGNQGNCERSQLSMSFNEIEHFQKRCISPKLSGQVISLEGQGQQENMKQHKSGGGQSSSTSTRKCPSELGCFRDVSRESCADGHSDIGVAVAGEGQCNRSLVVPGEGQCNSSLNTSGDLDLTQTSTQLLFNDTHSSNESKDKTRKPDRASAQNVNMESSSVDLCELQQMMTRECDVEKQQSIFSKIQSIQISLETEVNCENLEKEGFQRLKNTLKTLQTRLKHLNDIQQDEKSRLLNDIKDKNTTKNDKKIIKGKLENLRNRQKRLLDLFRKQSSIDSALKDALKNDLKMSMTGTERSVLEVSYLANSPKNEERGPQIKNAMNASEVRLGIEQSLNKTGSSLKQTSNAKICEIDHSLVNQLGDGNLKGDRSLLQSQSNSMSDTSVSISMQSLTSKKNDRLLTLVQDDMDLALTGSSKSNSEKRQLNVPGSTRVKSFNKVELQGSATSDIKKSQLHGSENVMGISGSTGFMKNKIQTGSDKSSTSFKVGLPLYEKSSTSSNLELPGFTKGGRGTSSSVELPVSTTVSAKAVNLPGLTSVSKNRVDLSGSCEVTRKKLDIYEFTGEIENTSVSPGSVRGTAESIKLSGSATEGTDIIMSSGSTGKGDSDELFHGSSEMLELSGTVRENADRVGLSGSAKCSTKMPLSFGSSKTKSNNEGLLICGSIGENINRTRLPGFAPAEMNNILLTDSEQGTRDEDLQKHAGTVDQNVFKSPTIAGRTSEVDIHNISPSTACSADVFPVKSKELDRRIQLKRLSSQQHGQVLTQSLDVEKSVATNVCTYRNKTPVIGTGVGLDQAKSASRDKWGGLKYPSLKVMMEADVLHPADDILSVITETKTFKASLTKSGKIRTIGGEVLRTPVKWLSAVLGEDLVKKSQAYREVLYDGVPLQDYIDGCAESSVRSKEADSTHDVGVKNNEEVTSHLESKHTRNPLEQSVTTNLADILRNCKLRLLSEDEILDTRNFPEYYWCNHFQNVKMKYFVWEKVDDWD